MLAEARDRLTLVIVEDETEALLPPDDVGAVAKCLARRAVGAHDDHEAVHDVAQDADVGIRQRGWRIEHDVVEALAQGRRRPGEPW